MKRFRMWLLLPLAFMGCSKKVVVQFTDRGTEMHSSESLTQIMLVNKSPKIVLRVPNTRKGVTNSQGTVDPLQTRRRKGKVEVMEPQYDDNTLYNTIEKQLFREGFSVRDRGLFNEVLDKAEHVDYSKVNGLTNTDLILEIINLNPEVGYNTNTCYQQGKNVKNAIKMPYNKQFVGASVEFKLVHVKTNEVVGSYKLHYTPCKQGCAYIYKGGRLKPVTGKTKIGPYEVMDRDTLENFMADATRQLVKAMR